MRPRVAGVTPTSAENDVFGRTKPTTFPNYSGLLLGPRNIGDRNRKLMYLKSGFGRFRAILAILADFGHFWPFLAIFGQKSLTNPKNRAFRRKSAQTSVSGELRD